MTRPRVAVWKFASCDGCQLSLLDCEDDLLAVAGAVDLAYFPEASSAMAPGPYDLSLVEGSITTPHDADRIREVREQSRVLVTIGACATAGGIQALRNSRDHAGMMSVVYARPDFIDMFVQIEKARATAYFAMMAVAEDDPRRTLAASMAKAAASDCQRLVCKESIQIHGGMGYTWESDEQLFVKRAKTLEALFGTGEAHRRRIADLLEV